MTSIERDGFTLCLKDLVHIEIFKRYKPKVEKEFGEVIKCLRTNRCGEFKFIEFNEFCSSEGIKTQLTVAYTLQQNGVAKKRNSTIMNMVRSMMSEKDVPKEFWLEALNWSTYVLNRSPTFVVN